MSLSDIQRRLTGLHLYHAGVDGEWGPLTEAALADLLSLHENFLATPSHEEGILPPTHSATAVVLHPNEWPMQGGAEAFYGTPGENLVHITPPYPMIWDLDPGDGRGKSVNYIVVNRHCADSLLRCFQAILQAYPLQADREARHLHWFAGSYALRNIRGGHNVSMHSYGCAIDLAATWNAQHALYDESKGMMPMKVVRIFEDEGWTWGGRWSPRSVDAMHFQAARIG